MKKAGKFIIYAAILLVVIIVCAVTYITVALPNVGDAENITIEATPKRIERGKYLALHVTVCLDCHSPHDKTKFASPMDTTLLGAGGEKFDSGVGFPGNVVVPNITSYNLKNWTDGELYRAITTGVKKDGSAIFPLMPWPYYSKMDREDVYSIIAFLRTINPVAVTHPKAKLDFPLNILVHTMPQKAVPGKLPNPSDTLKYGEYLVQSAACKDCHSQDKDGKLLPGLEFAGGKAFKVGKGKVYTANITSDTETGIGGWTRDQFVSRFKTYADAGKAADANSVGYETIMPWWNYGGMSESDLKSIYTYLHTIKPIKNRVVKYVADDSSKPM